MKKLLTAFALAALFAPVAALADSTITATTDTGSFVSPSGTLTVPTGADQLFTIRANDGFTLTSVSLDGAPQPLGSVDFVGVDADTVDHTLFVSSQANAPTGGTMPWCSGPLAPGYNVSLPGGGCGQTTSLVPYNHPLGDGTLCPFNNGCMVPIKL
jgi:hypothetical protein